MNKNILYLGAGGLALYFLSRGGVFSTGASPQPTAPSLPIGPITPPPEPSPVIPPEVVIPITDGPPITPAGGLGSTTTWNGKNWVFTLNGWQEQLSWDLLAPAAPVSPSPPAAPSPPAPKPSDFAQRSGLNGPEIFIPDGAGSGNWVSQYQTGGFWQPQGTHAHFIDYQTSLLPMIQEGWRFRQDGTPYQISGWR